MRRARSATVTEPAYVYIEDGIQRGVTLEVSAAHPEMPAPSSPGIDGPELIEVSFSTDAGTAVAFLEDLTLADYHPVSLFVPVPASTFSAGPDGVQRGRAIAFFTPRQDSEPEETETLWFVIERAPIIPFGEMHLERPDGRRGTEGARYPVTIVEANTPAAGAAGISGSGRAGETLRATTDAITDADGLADATYRYRWIRIDGDAETEVGTDSAVYMPVAGDIGKRIRVEVSLTDDLGFAEGPFASAAVAIHAAMPPAVCPAPGPAGAGRSALASVGVEVGAIRFVGTPVAYGYFKGDTVLSAGGAITGASVAIGGTGYTVEGAWAGTAGSLVLNLDAAVSAAERAALVLHVCGESYAFADAEHHSATDAYTWRHAGLDWSGVAERTLRLSTTRSLPTGAPGIEGTGRIGETLAATTDGIDDADGRSNADFAYQWLRVDAGVETDIAGATAGTYTVTADDVHKGVRVRVRFTDDRSFAEAATSAVLAIVNTPATGAPELSGAARAGATVRARMGTVADADGLGNADYSYRWLLIDGTQESEVGTDSSSYGLAAADEGKRIRVEVTFTDDLGTREGPLASAPAAILDGSPPLSSSCGAPGLAGREQIWSSRITLALVGGGIGFHVSQSGTHIQDPDFEIGSAPAYSIRGGKVFRGRQQAGGDAIRAGPRPDGVARRGACPARLRRAVRVRRRGARRERAHLHLARRRGRVAWLSLPTDPVPERGGEQPGERRAGGFRHGPGRRDAERADARHRRRGRARGGALQLPVGAGRGRDRDGDFGGDGADLRAHGGRRGQAGRGAGELHRRPRHGRGAAREPGLPGDGDGCGGGGAGDADRHLVGQPRGEGPRPRRAGLHQQRRK